MKIGKTTGWLISLSASAFLHVAVLSVAKLIVPRGRTPATEISKERIHPVELIALGPEPKPPIVMPQITPVQVAVPEVNPPENPNMPKPEPDKPQAGKPLAPVRRRSGSRPATVDPVPSPPEPMEAATTTPIPAPKPLPEPEPVQQTIMVSVNGQLFPIHVGAPAGSSGPASVATSPDRGEGEPVARPGELDPTPVLIPRWRMTEDGFIVSLHDPTITCECYQEREFRFRREENGDYVYRDPDGRNSVIIHPNGRVEYQTSRIAVNGTSGSFVPPWEDPNLSPYISGQIREAIAPVVRQIAEQYDSSVTREALDNLSQELLEIIERHSEWSLAQQRDFLFRRWDECREDSVGNEARTTIEEFIRRHYPQGTPREITEEELRSFNERRQTESQSFSPYPD